MRATKALIHLDNFTANIKAVRDHLKTAGSSSPLLCVPVKADGYGHGAVPVARAALKAGANFLAIATVDEGVELRDAGIDSPILLLSQALPSEMETVAEHSLSPFVADKDAAKLIADAAAMTRKGKKLPVHIKIDTGMGRMGCYPNEAAELAACIASFGSLEIAGTATHLAVSDSAVPDDIAYTKKQIEKFNQAVNSIKAAGYNPGIVHAANTGAAIAHSDAWFDMVRPGILLYGYPPGGITPRLLVRPVMEVVTNIVFIKQVKKGDSISYGRTWTAPHDTVVGIIPIGYGDGLPRILSKDFDFTINGIQYPLAGRICMDQCMIDLGADTDVKRWDEVSVFGGAYPAAHNAATIAARIGTIPYEITCNINKRVARVYV
ncbi:alanine racemase [Spirochaetia bacterium]|nr:alanine racemase [Spirochaetia bacterium]